MSEKKKIGFMVIVPDDIPASDLGTIFTKLKANFRDYDWVLRSEDFEVREQ
jgi:hypothetical protein